MITHVKRGSRMPGLMVYLAGPGKRNEHTDPHLVAGDPSAMALHGDSDLDRNGALEVAHHLDAPKDLYGTEVREGHVWHCSLSLGPQDGELSDEQWAEIAQEFVSGMEMDGSDGRSPLRWAAVRHGLSANGNDHIHLAVSVVAEDGTKWWRRGDFFKAREVAGEIERRHGLTFVGHGAESASEKGYDPAAKEAAARARAEAKYVRERGGDGAAWKRLSAAERRAKVADHRDDVEPSRALANRVRAAATASRDEAEFVRRCRRTGLLVRPRFAHGRTDVVTGWSVAERPKHGERPIWRGGGKLGRDLTLTALRKSWPDTPENATAAAAEWKAAGRHRKPVAPGRELKVPDADEWSHYNQQLDRLRKITRTIEPHDRAAWGRVAHEVSGTLAAWSRRLGDDPDLAHAARIVGRSAQVDNAAGPQSRVDEVRGAMAGSAMLMMQGIAGGRSGPVGDMLLVKQMVGLIRAIHDMQVAQGQAVEAARLAEAGRDRLRSLHQRYEAADRTHEAPGRPVAVAEPPHVPDLGQAPSHHGKTGQATPGTDRGGIER